MTVEEAVVFFANQPKIARKLQTLLDVGLGYVTWGRAPPHFPAAKPSVSSWPTS